MVLLEITCRMCKTVHHISVKPSDLRRWQDGELIQNVFPELPPEVRELMISSVCSECFDEMFKEVG